MPSSQRNMQILQKKKDIKVCMKINVKQLHEIVDSPNYEGQDIYLRPDDCAEFAVNPFAYQDGSSDTKAIAVILVCSC